MAAMRVKMRINHINKLFDGQETLYFNPVCASKYPKTEATRITPTRSFRRPECCR